MSSFTLYLTGFLILITGLAYGAYELGVQPVWIGTGTGAVVLVGFGIITAVSKTRRRDESPANEN